MIECERRVICIEIICGLRRGELLGLRWENTDLENGKINIKENLIEAEGELFLRQPKTKSSVRSIDIPPTLVDLLRDEYTAQNTRRFKAGDEYSQDDFVICQSNGYPYSSDSMSRKWRRFLDRHGLRRIRFHDLRHTSATLLLNAGVNIKVIQSRLGHADIGTTMNIYAHAAVSAKREAADKMEEIIFKVG